jgi:hypothetical protein
VSAPSATGTTPAATATALPPLLPPAMSRGSWGLRTAPYARLFEVMPADSSCMPVLPTTTAPAARRTRTTVASAAGRQSRNAGVPAVHGNPATWMLSFTAIGTPSSGPPVTRCAGASASATNALSPAVSPARASAASTCSFMLGCSAPRGSSRRA